MRKFLHRSFPYPVYLTYLAISAFAETSSRRLQASQAHNHMDTEVSVFLEDDVNRDD